MSARERIKVLIVDDERAARHRLEELAARRANIEVVGTAANGAEAVEAIIATKPDLVFLDVQMPGLTGTDVVREIGPENMPAVIFVTAFDQYAIEAFEMAAVDYLLKPFDDERFDQALARARDLLTFRAMDDLRRRLAELLDEDSETPTERRYLERIGVDMRGQMRIVPVERIDYIVADGSYAELHVGGDRFVIREQMQVLEERLDPEQFFRIHRSTIVRLDRVDALTFSGGGEYAVRLKDGESLRVSRGRYEALRDRLGLEPSGAE